MTNSLEAMHVVGADSGAAEQCALREAGKQFEGLLLGMILKESLQSVFSDEEGETSSGMEMMRDVCVEQLAASLSETSPIGLADQLVQQVNAGGSHHAGT